MAETRSKARGEARPAAVRVSAIAQLQYPNQHKPTSLEGGERNIGVGKRKGGRRVKTAQQVQTEAEQRKRNSLIASGVPSHQVEGIKVNEYETNVKYIRRPVQNIVDRWLKEGGPGFDEPQSRAIEHCRELWHAIGSQGQLVANLDRIGGGNAGPRQKLWQNAEALTQLGLYQREFLSYWNVFEDIVRWNTPATIAGEHLHQDNGRRIENCKRIVAMIASVIANARRY